MVSDVASDGHKCGVIVTFQSTINRLLRPSGTIWTMSGWHVLRMREPWLTLPPLFYLDSQKLPLKDLSPLKNVYAYRWINWRSCCMITSCWVDVAASLWFQRVVDHRQTRFPASDTERPINGSADLSLVTVSVQREPLQSAAFTSVQMFQPQSIRLPQFLWHPLFCRETKMLLCHLLLALMAPNGEKNQQFFPTLRLHLWRKKRTLLVLSLWGQLSIATSSTVEKSTAYDYRLGDSRNC